MIVTNFDATLIGALAGAAGAAIATVAGTAVFMRRSETGVRRDARAEHALEDILAAAEGDHWTLVTRYKTYPGATEVVLRDHERDAAALIRGLSNLFNDFSDIADRLAEEVRRLRLFISRVEDAELRRVFTDYFNLVNEAQAAASAAKYLVLFGDLEEVDEEGNLKLAARAKGVVGHFIPGEALTDRLVELLRATNAKLGYEFWDGRDMSKADRAGRVRMRFQDATGDPNAYLSDGVASHAPRGSLAVGPDSAAETDGGRPTGPGEDRLAEPVIRTGMFGAQTTGDTSGYGRLRIHRAPLTESPQPYGSYFDEIADALGAALEIAGVGFSEAVERVVVDRNEITFHVRRDKLPEVAAKLRDDPALRFEQCSGVSGVHYPEEAGRELHAVYHLLSIAHNRRVRLEVSLPDGDPHVPSLVGVYPTCNWHERETWDFFGIIFDGHPALTRIQMPDDWKGHPQRKDYPLGGIPVEYRGAKIPPPNERGHYS